MNNRINLTILFGILFSLTPPAYADFCKEHEGEAKPFCLALTLIKSGNCPVPSPRRASLSPRSLGIEDEQICEFLIVLGTRLHDQTGNPCSDPFFDTPGKKNVCQHILKGIRNHVDSKYCETSKESHKEAWTSTRVTGWDSACKFGQYLGNNSKDFLEKAKAAHKGYFCSISQPSTLTPVASRSMDDTTEVTQFEDTPTEPLLIAPGVKFDDQMQKLADAILALYPERNKISPTELKSFKDALAERLSPLRHMNRPTTDQLVSVDKGLSYFELERVENTFQYLGMPTSVMLSPNEPKKLILNLSNLQVGSGAGNTWFKTVTLDDQLNISDTSQIGTVTPLEGPKQTRGRLEQLQRLREINGLLKGFTSESSTQFATINKTLFVLKERLPHPPEKVAYQYQTYHELGSAEGAFREDRLTHENILDGQIDFLDQVAFAHSKGVIHRDLKPSNIFVDENGKFHLGDFGEAATTADDNTPRMPKLTGTMPFMAPELFPENLHTTEELKPADAWAAGLSLYFFETGQSGCDTRLKIIDSYKALCKICGIFCTKPEKEPRTPPKTLQEVFRASQQARLAVIYEMLNPDKDHRLDPKTASSRLKDLREKHQERLREYKLVTKKGPNLDRLVFSIKERANEFFHDYLGLLETYLAKEVLPQLEIAKKKANKTNRTQLITFDLDPLTVPSEIRYILPTSAVVPPKDLESTLSLNFENFGVGQGSNRLWFTSLGLSGDLLRRPIVENRLGSHRTFNLDNAQEMHKYRDLSTEYLASRKLASTDVSTFANHFEFKSDTSIKAYSYQQFHSKGDLFNARSSLTSKELNNGMVDLLQQLSDTHSKNIVHGDLKPQNVYVNDLGQFLLGDFGSSQIKAAGRFSRFSRTFSGTFVAPEIAKDLRTRSITGKLPPQTFEQAQASDAWSMGLILYFMETGIGGCQKSFVPGKYPQFLNQVVANINSYDDLCNFCGMCKKTDLSPGNTPLDRLRAKKMKIIYDLLNPNPSKRPKLGIAAAAMAEIISTSRHK